MENELSSHVIPFYKVAKTFFKAPQWASRWFYLVTLTPRGAGKEITWLSSLCCELLKEEEISWAWLSVSEQTVLPYKTKQKAGWILE